MIETALAEVQSTKAAWTAADLTRAINDALPDHLGDPTARQIAELLDELTAEALEAGGAAGRRPARPSERCPTSCAWPTAARPTTRLARGCTRPRSTSTPSGCSPQATARSRRARRSSRPPRGGSSSELRETGIELGADQAAAVRGVLTSGAASSRWSGRPAPGSPSSSVCSPRPGRTPRCGTGSSAKVVGLASSQIATDVLAGEGLHARNITRWLATQQRLAARHRRSATTSTGGSARATWSWSTSPRWPTPPTSPPSTATSTPPARSCCSPATTASSPRSAPPAACNSPPRPAPTYELAEARRFTHAWERAASLRLRDGDETVLGEYHKHGRIIDGGAIEQAERSAARAWLADTLAGRRSLLIVDTNEQAARLSAQLRAELVRLGRVDEDGVPLGLQGTIAGVGDLVQARRNGWDLAGVHGNRRGPINREQLPRRSRPATTAG